MSLFSVFHLVGLGSTIPGLPAGWRSDGHDVVMLAWNLPKKNSNQAVSQ
jgi:hypothetical protein